MSGCRETVRSVVINRTWCDGGAEHFFQAYCLCGKLKSLCACGPFLLRMVWTFSLKACAR